MQYGTSRAAIDLIRISSWPIYLSHTASTAPYLDVDRAAAVRGAGVVVELQPRLVLVEAGALPPHGRAARRLRHGRRRAHEHREDVRRAAERPERRHGHAPREEGQDVRGAERQGGEDVAARATPRDAAARGRQQHGAERGCHEQGPDDGELGVGRHGGLRLGDGAIWGKDLLCTGSLTVAAWLRAGGSLASVLPRALPCQKWRATVKTG